MSKIEVNTVAPQCGTTLTLGESGDTVTLGSGASQSGFGRTGTVDWQTGSIKTATFTAANGEGYFCNTTGGSFEVDLPAGSAGAIVSIQDYNNTFDSNSLTIDPNGSPNFMSIAYFRVGAAASQLAAAGINPNDCYSTGHLLPFFPAGPRAGQVNAAVLPAIGADIVQNMIAADMHIIVFSPRKQIW